MRRHRHGHGERRKLWRKKVGAHYDGVRAGSKRLRGTPLDRSKSIDLLQDYIATVSEYTNSTSPIVASGSTDILAALSRCDKLNQSGQNIIFEFNKVFPDVSEDFKDIVEKLAEHNGKLTSAFIGALTEFASVFSNYMKEVLSEGDKKEVDFKPVLEKLQKLTNIVAEASNNSAATQEELDTVLVLNLIYLYLSNAVHGITGCSLEVLHKVAYTRRQNYRVRESIKSLLSSVDISLALQAVKGGVSPLNQSVKEVLTNVSKITKELSKTFNRILGRLDKIDSKNSTKNGKDSISTKTNVVQNPQP